MIRWIALVVVWCLAVATLGIGFVGARKWWKRNGCEFVAAWKARFRRANSSTRLHARTAYGHVADATRRFRSSLIHTEAPPA